MPGTPGKMGFVTENAPPVMKVLVNMGVQVDSGEATLIEDRT